MLVPLASKNNLVTCWSNTVCVYVRAQVGLPSEELVGKLFSSLVTDKKAAEELLERCMAASVQELAEVRTQPVCLTMDPRVQI